MTAGGRTAAATSARRLFAAAAVTCVLLADRTGAAAKTRVVFTVDVETSRAYSLADQVDMICADGTRCGLMEIARMLEARGLAATFFVNVYEHSRWSEAAMRNMTVRLQTAGQDVGLHTHPATVYDASRTEMYEYTLDEQTAIVREGVRLLHAWSGRPVVSHRAGDYGADANTLEALRRNGVKVDSSLFWGHPHSGLDVLGLPRNLPSFHGGLTEIPVTVYQREDRPGPFGSILPPVTVTRKIDVDWLINAGEMRAAIDAGVAADLPVLVVFLHSFSLIGAPNNGAPVSNRPSIDMLSAIIDYVSSKGLQVVTMREIAAEGGDWSAARVDVVPRIPVRIDWPRYLWHAAKAAASFTAAEVAIALVSIGGAVVLIRRRRRLAGVRWQPPRDARSIAKTKVGSV
jgi:peptidoglycan/xylan/chitin deacetylase (PgdA/CDA1 family)